MWLWNDDGKKEWLGFKGAANKANLPVCDSLTPGATASEESTAMGRKLCNGQFAQK